MQEFIYQLFPYAKILRASKDATMSKTVSTVFLTCSFFIKDF